jgi:hypothetical protein
MSAVGWEAAAQNVEGLLAETRAALVKWEGMRADAAEVPTGS